MSDPRSRRTRQRALRRLGVILVGIVVSTGLQSGKADAAERTGPVKIGALTPSCAKIRPKATRPRGSRT
jgi:hypothetical protein